VSASLPDLDPLGWVMYYWNSESLYDKLN